MDISLKKYWILQQNSCKTGEMMRYNFDRYEEKITLRDAKRFISALDTLVYFVEFVELKDSFMSFSSEYEVCTEALQQAYKSFGVKVIRPMKKLCLRILEEGIGLTNIHLLFIQICVLNKLFDEGLSVVEKKAIPKNMSSEDFYYYTYFCGVLYAELNMFGQASDCFQSNINRVGRIMMNPQVVLKCLKMAILCSVISGRNVITRAKINTLIEDLKLTSPIFQNWGTENQKELQIFINICEGKNLNKQEEQRLKKQDLWRYYIKIDSKALKMRNDISTQIARKIERIRSSELLGQPLNQYSTLKRINSLSQMCKYDCKQRILYFNHEVVSEEELNSIISRCFEMYEIISAEKMEEKKEMGFGGLGGMGGALSALGGFGFRM